MPGLNIVKSPNEEHLIFLCRIASLLGLIVSLGWLVVFAAMQEWKLVSSELLLAAAAFPCWRIAMRGHFSAGLMLAQLVCIIYVIVFCLLFDIPESGIPRSTHLYLPVIALVGYFNYQRHPDRLQASAIVVSLLAFIVLSSADLIFSFADPMPHHFRTFSPWVNALIATAIFCGGIAAMHADFSRRTEKVRAIQNALFNDELVLFFQPLLNSCGQVTGAEALLRWQHPQQGLLPPSAFIPDAQRAGLMPAVGNWVIVHAFRELAKWQADPLTRDLTLSINITVDHLMKADFVANLISQANITQIAPSRVKLELTESVFASDMDTVVTKMNTLAAAGFRFSLDDFGTGFSSLSYLRRLPLAQIKIDRSFISGATDNPKGAVIARSIARMGMDLNLEVLAEGIETPEQWLMMQDFGCTAFQGFYFSRPLSFSDFRDFLTCHRVASSKRQP